MYIKHVIEVYIYQHVVLFCLPLRRSMGQYQFYCIRHEATRMHLQEIQNVTKFIMFIAKQFVSGLVVTIFNKGLFDI